MHIQQLQAAMRNGGCKNTYNNLVLDATVRVLRFAKLWRRIRDDVTRLPERDIKPVARVLESQEKKRLFEVAKSKPNWTTTYAAALIATGTTARGADLRGLRWSDIDLFDGVMKIPDSKTDAGKRRVPLNSDAIHGFRLLVDRASGSESLARNATYSRPARTYGLTQRVLKRRGARHGAISQEPLG